MYLFINIIYKLNEYLNKLNKYLNKYLMHGNINISMHLIFT